MGVRTFRGIDRLLRYNFSEGPLSIRLELVNLSLARQSHFIIHDNLGYHPLVVFDQQLPVVTRFKINSFVIYLAIKLSKKKSNNRDKYHVTSFFFFFAAHQNLRQWRLSRTKSSVRPDAVAVGNF